MTAIQMQINLNQSVIEQAVRNLIKEQGIDAPIASVDFELVRQRGKPDEITATINIGGADEGAPSKAAPVAEEKPTAVVEEPATKEEVAPETAAADNKEESDASEDSTESQEQKESLFG